jgi:hypothetical protein
VDDARVDEALTDSAAAGALRDFDELFPGLIRAVRLPRSEIEKCRKRRHGKDDY